MYRGFLHPIWARADKTFRGRCGGWAACHRHHRWVGFDRDDGGSWGLRGRRSKSRVIISAHEWYLEEWNAIGAGSAHETLAGGCTERWWVATEGMAQTLERRG